MELPANIVMATNKDAPELMPNTYGPASGLRNIICKIRPAIAKVLPAKTAVTVFGNRICQKIKLDVSEFNKFKSWLPPIAKLSIIPNKKRIIKIINLGILDLNKNLVNFFIVIKFVF